MHVATHLQDIHDAGFVHCCVKPEHIVLFKQENRWMLTDFDRAAPIAHPVPPSHALSYSPPEVVWAASAGHAAIAADPVVDAWALGIVAFELLTGQQVYRQPASGDAPVRSATYARPAPGAAVVACMHTPAACMHCPMRHLPRATVTTEST